MVSCVHKNRSNKQVTLILNDPEQGHRSTNYTSCITDNISSDSGREKTLTYNNNADIILRSENLQDKGKCMSVVVVWSVESLPSKNPTAHV